MWAVPSGVSEETSKENWFRLQYQTSVCTFRTYNWLISMKHLR